jgi:phosphotransferase system enzyme I (PtsI)
MCGEMANSPLYAPLLLGMGLEDLSMNPQAIPAVKRMIRSISLSDARAMIRDVLACKTAKQTFEILREAYGDLVENHLVEE